MHLTVKIPVMDDQLTHKKAHQLERLTARDTTIIKRYLTIIEREEEQLWQQGREGRKLDSNKLDAITLTSRPLTRKNRRTGAVITTPGRLVVKYDLKMEFADRITVRELKECRDTAVELWHSYRQKVQEHERIYWKIMGNPKYFDREDELAEVLHWWKTKKKPQPPCQTKGYRLKKLPRRVTIGTTAFFHEKHTKLTTYWLEIYYSVGKSKNPRGCDRLWIPLNCSRYHLNQLQLGKVKTVHLVKHKDTKRWIAHFSVVIDIDQTPPPDKPVAVVGIDLGMKKAATAVLLTAARQLKGKNIQFFNQDKQRRAINKLDDTIASLQLRKARYESTSKCTKNIVRKLKQGASKRRQLAIQSDHEMTARISRWIKRFEHRYTVHVAVGQLKGIRNSRWKGDGNSRKHRRDLHRWPFARFTTMIQYKLQRLGFSPSRFVLVKESWTSKTCWKCGSTDTHRPFQSLLICNSCGAHLQADINGAVNIRSDAHLFS